MHEAAQGAFTGEISAAMLADAGRDRRAARPLRAPPLFGETDEALARKVPRRAGGRARAVLCVGETEAEREAARRSSGSARSSRAALDELDAARALQLTIAYEPVWAIGTGRTATPEQAQEAHADMRAWLARAFGADVAETVRILYGGSVKPENARELLEAPDVDGALVGGAQPVGRELRSRSRARRCPGR